MLIHSFGTLDNNAVLRHLAADSRKPDIDDPMTHSTAFIGGSAVWSLCRRHLGVVIGDDSIIRVARQSGWEGGDDQECILTVAAD